MELTQFLLFAGALFILSVLLIGSGIALYSNRRKSEAERIAEEKQSILGGSTSESETVFSESSSVERGGQDSGQVELLRVLREPIDGGLTIQLQGANAKSATDLNINQHEQLRRLLNEMERWTDEGKPQAPVDVPISEPENQETGSEVAPVPFASTLPERVALKDAIPFRRKKAPKLEEAPPPPRSIAEQIDEIVQHKLERSSLTGMSVHLSEELGGGLRIVVGDREYQAIDEVENADVKALIKEAVRDWNEKNRLGSNPPGA